VVVVFRSDLVAGIVTWQKDTGWYRSYCLLIVLLMTSDRTQLLHCPHQNHSVKKGINCLQPNPVRTSLITSARPSKASGEGAKE
jgi:hypothetical protein